MGIKQELGKKIKRIRLEKGYTQDKLSEIKDAKDLLQKINENIALIGDDSDRLEIIYNLTKSLVR